MSWHFIQLLLFLSLDGFDDDDDNNNDDVSVNVSERSYDSAMDTYGQTDTTLCLVRVLFTAYHDDRIFLQACIPPLEAKGSSSQRYNLEDISSLKSQASQSQKKKEAGLVNFNKNSAALPLDFLQDDVISSRYVDLAGL